MEGFRVRLVRSWWKRSTVATTSSSVKLWCVMVPLVVVFGLVILWGPTSWGSDLEFASNTTHSNLLAWSWPSASPANTSSVNAIALISSAAQDSSQGETEKPDEDNAKRKKKKYSNLEMLEAGLSEARVAIKEDKSAQKAAADHGDFVPKGSIYLNATAFHRSYLEMEKRLKVFVYEEGDPPLFHNGPCKQTYAIEGHFIHAMELSSFRTNDPTKAHLYYLPISMNMIRRFVSVPHEWDQMKDTVKDYVDVIANKYPFWNRSLGSDHFFLSCHDWAPELSNAVPYLYKNSIRALCNANTSERFDPSKDVSIPEIRLPFGTLGGPSPSNRPTLVFFAGGMHGPVRPILQKYWENKDEDVQVHQYLPKGSSYYGMMRKSKYCICPSGFEVASPRTVEALYTGCVPVLIKNGYAIPFNDVLNWKTFSVIIPAKDIPNLKKILMAIPQRQYIEMQRRGIQVRRHFEVNSPPKRYDVFHMILHSTWLRRLNIRFDANES